MPDRALAVLDKHGTRLLNPNVQKCPSSLLGGEMAKGKASGIVLTNRSASIVLGMVARGDRDHDIAAWFGVNQGRIAEVKAGEFGNLTAAPPAELPPKGPPGLKGRRLREAVVKALQQVDSGTSDVAMLKRLLEDAVQKFNEHEA